MENAPVTQQDVPEPDAATARPVRSNRRGEQTRVELFEAGLRLMCTVPLDQLLSSISVGEICASAGRTSGAFHHHFPNWTAYVRGLVEHLADVLFDDLDQQILGTFEHLRPDEVQAMVRAGAEWMWDPGDPWGRLLNDSLHMISALGRRPVGDEPEFVRRVFADRYWPLHQEHMTAMYQSVMNGWGRELMPPYTITDFKVMAAVLEAGLRGCDNIGLLDGEGKHYGEAMLGLVVQMTRPVGRSYQFDDTISDLYHGAPWALEPGSDLSALDWTTLAELLDAPGEIPMSAIARALDLELADAVRLIGTPQRGVALAAGSWLNDLRLAGSRREGDALVALVDVVVELARAARAQPRIASSLLIERGLERQSSDNSPPTMHELVPFDLVVCPALGELTGRGPSGVASDASLVVDTVLLIGSTRPAMAPADIATRALAVVGIST